MKLAVGAGDANVYTGGKALDASLPAIVFVHGALNDHSVWTLLARWFAHRGHAVLAVDLPGHSGSSGPALASVEALADWLLALLDVAGIEKAAFVGHSMGSLIALETAARAPTRATRLVMVATAYPMTVSKALLDAAENDAGAAIDSVNAFSHSTMAGKPSYPGPGSWLHGGNRALMRRLQRAAAGNLFVDDFRVCDRYRTGLEAAARVTCPATLVLGEHDHMTSPKQTAELAAALRADVCILPAGHAVMAEAPELVLAALRKALSQPTVA